MSCVSCTSAWTTSAIFHRDGPRRATIAGGDECSASVFSATIIGDLQSASLPARRHRRPLRRSGGCTANATFGPFGGAGNTDTGSRDANGTYDIGPLPFNTAYLASRRRFGITPRAVEGRSAIRGFSRLGAAHSRSASRRPWWVVDPGGAISQRDAPLCRDVPSAAPRVRPALARLADRPLPDGRFGAVTGAGREALRRSLL